MAKCNEIHVVRHTRNIMKHVELLWAIIAILRLTKNVNVCLELYCTFDVQNKHIIISNFQPIVVVVAEFE